LLQTKTNSQAPFGGSKTKEMTTAHATQSTSVPSPHSATEGLVSEARELDALHAGLKRHVAAWVTAHETAVVSLATILKRMDSILERIERNRR